MLMLTRTHAKIVSRLESEIAVERQAATDAANRAAGERNRADTTGRALSEALAQRDALQAKIDRMTTGNLPKRAPKSNGSDAAKAN